jgi:P27 family predicted phage terminase small subunit
MSGPVPQRIRKIESGFGPSKVPPPPRGLNIDAVREWKSVGEILLRRGLLGPDTMAALEVHCRALADMRFYARLLEDRGHFIEMKQGTVRHPAHGGYLAAMQKVLQTSAELGLTPSRRAVAMKIRKADKHDDGWDDELLA